MGTTLKDLKFLLEMVLQCEREEGRRHTKYFLWSCLTDAVRRRAASLARPIARYFLKVNGRIVAWTFYSRSWKSSTEIDDSTVSDFDATLNDVLANEPRPTSL